MSSYGATLALMTEPLLRIKGDAKWEAGRRGWDGAENICGAFGGGAVSARRAALLRRSQSSPSRAAIKQGAASGILGTANTGRSTRRPEEDR